VVFRGGQGGGDKRDSRGSFGGAAAGRGCSIRNRGQKGTQSVHLPRSKDTIKYMCASKPAVALTYLMNSARWAEYGYVRVCSVCRGVGGGGVRGAAAWRRERGGVTGERSMGRAARMGGRGWSIRA
jgi:hypothetical protein